MTIADRDVPTTVIGRGKVSLARIQAEFDSSIAKPVVGDFVDLRFNLTYSNGSLLKHLTARLVLLDPDGHVLLSSGQIHEHTGQFLVKAKFMKEGVHRIVLYIEPTMLPMRTETEIGFQVATFGLQVESPADNSDTNDTSGFESIIVVLGLFAFGGFLLAKRGQQN